MKHNASYNVISQYTEGNALHFTCKHTHLFREKETNASFYFQASYPSRLPVTLQATISKPALPQPTFRREW